MLCVSAAIVFLLYMLGEKQYKYNTDAGNCVKIGQMKNQNFM